MLDYKRGVERPQPPSEPWWFQSWWEVTREPKSVEVDVGDAAHPAFGKARERGLPPLARVEDHRRGELYLRAYDPWTSDELSTLWSEDVDAVLEHWPDRLRDEPGGFSGRPMDG